jgi:hypothetical protein
MRRAAEYVDRFFKGTDPADLPVQTPTRFNLAIANSPWSDNFATTPGFRSKQPSRRYSHSLEASATPVRRPAWPRQPDQAHRRPSLSQR